LGASSSAEGTEGDDAEVLGDYRAEEIPAWNRRTEAADPSKGNVINTAFQSAGVICAKRAMVLHEKYLKD
jgi:hypothetical protein